MTALPVILLVTAASALGAYLLLLWFRKDRKPVLIGFHVLLGLGCAELLAGFLRLGGFDDKSSIRRLALAGGACLAAALLSGFSAPLFGKSYRLVANSLLAAHVLAGLAGFLIVLAFVSQI